MRSFEKQIASTIVEIRLEDIKVAFERIFRELERSKRSVFVAEVDYYWEIPQETRYDPYKKPAEFTLGQISKEIADVKRVARQEDEPISNDLRSLGVLLLLMGER